MRFVFEQVRVGGDRNFGYLIGDRQTRIATVVDPSYSPESLCDRATVQGLKVAYILNTHGHPDHTNGNSAAKALTNAPIGAYKNSSINPDTPLDDGQCIQLGAVSLHFIYTPGHCADHLSIYIPEVKLALTGDLLFVGKVGGTQNDSDAELEWNSLQRLIELLPAETTIWPGHDYGCRPASTMALERATNPFLLCPSVNEFLVLKRNWASFKSDHGLK